MGVSLENLDRAPEEVELITEIARQTLTALSERDKVKRLEMSLRVIGRRELLPERLREAAERGEAETAGRPGLRVTLALATRVGDELVEAARAAIRTLLAEGVTPDGLPDALTAEQLEAHLYTRGSSDPDLIIRTSGEVRLSGFLPGERLQRVLLLRRVLAGVPPARLPARHPHVSAPRAALRPLRTAPISTALLSKNARPPTICLPLLRPPSSQGGRFPMIDSGPTILSLSDVAAGKLREITAGEANPNVGLRVYVYSGGCSGFRYGMMIEDAPTAEDRVLESQGIKVYVDTKSLDLLTGSQIDYADTRWRGFTVNNPNAVAACGCGSSFRTAESEGAPGACHHRVAIPPRGRQVGGGAKCCLTRYEVGIGSCRATATICAMKRLLVAVPGRWRQLLGLLRRAGHWSWDRVPRLLAVFAICGFWLALRVARAPRSTAAISHLPAADQDRPCRLTIPAWAAAAPPGSPIWIALLLIARRPRVAVRRSCASP